MDSRDIFKTLNQIIDLEGSLNRLTKKPISSYNVKDYTQNLTELAKLKTDFLNNFSFEDIMNYHRFVKQKAEKELFELTRDYEGKIKDYEEQLRKAEEDKAFIGRYNAELG